MVDIDIEKVNSMIVEQDTHWVWCGRMANSNDVPVFYTSEDSDTPYSMRIIVARLLYFGSYDNSVSTNARQLVRLCDEPKCVNPKHHAEKATYSRVCKHGHVVTMDNCRKRIRTLTSSLRGTRTVIYMECKQCVGERRKG